MTATQANELAELLALPHMEGLRELSLDDNELESEGAVLIAKGVKVNLMTTLCLFAHFNWLSPDFILSCVVLFFSS